MIKTETLQKIYLFQDLNAEEMGKVARVCKEANATAGQELFFTGQAAESFFVIQQGEVKIFSTTDGGDEVQITKLATGAHFGEIPFLTGDKRTATAQTTEASFLIEVPYASLKSLLADDAKISAKVHRSLAMFLASRLKATTQDFKKVKETVLRHF